MKTTLVDEILLKELDKYKFKAYLISYVMDTFNDENKRIQLIEFLRDNCNVLLNDSDIYKFAYEMNNDFKVKTLSNNKR